MSAWDIACAVGCTPLAVYEWAWLVWLERRAVARERADGGRRRTDAAGDRLDEHYAGVGGAAERRSGKLQ